MTEENEEYILPYQSPQISRQLEILKAYCILSEERKNPVGYKEVSDLTKISEISISGNNKFFVYTGFLEEIDRKYVPSEKLLEFMNKLEWKKEDEAKNILRQMLAKTWFIDSLSRLMQFRGEMSRDDIISELGAKAGVKRSKSNMQRLNRLFEWIEYAEIILESSSDTYKMTQVISRGKSEEKTAKLLGLPERNLPSRSETPIEAVPAVVFAINIKPETTEEELEKMLKLIRRYTDKDLESSHENR
ncbi:MAG: hypothetical protein HXS54_14580 [Theionarchaea archaeon]|nr:hypothetical protein [Theionarchaea archaeon]